MYSIKPDFKQFYVKWEESSNKIIQSLKYIYKFILFFPGVPGFLYAH